MAISFDIKKWPPIQSDVTHPRNVCLVSIAPFDKLVTKYMGHLLTAEYAKEYLLRYEFTNLELDYLSEMGDVLDLVYLEYGRVL